jgi:hypothetical protein
MMITPEDSRLKPHKSVIVPQSYNRVVGCGRVHESAVGGKIVIPAKRESN